MNTSADVAAPGDGAESYIRGGAGAATTTRNVLMVGLICVLVALLVLAAALAVNAAHKNARAALLHNHGVPVTATVTSCFGIASGTGITVDGYVCRGGFEIDGHRYNEVIRGSSGLHHRGDVVAAVVDPGHPATLSTVAAAERAHSSWRAYVASLSLTVGVLIAAGAIAWWARRRRSREIGGANADELPLPGGSTNDAGRAVDPTSAGRPALVGVHHLGLTVSDVEASAAWYARVLGFNPIGEFHSEGGERRKVFLRHDGFNVRLGLTQHQSRNGSEFDETRIGLDHLAFAVSGAAELEAWATRLAAAAVVSCPVAPAHTVAGGLVLVFRDPDNIQLELFVDPHGDTGQVPSPDSR